jgi:uncharacterized protein YbaR (Trm112 family)
MGPPMTDNARTDPECAALSNKDILTLWETGEHRHDVDKALLIAAAFDPGLGWDELARLPLGRRDSLIIRLRERMFGDRIPIAVQCPNCRERLEFDTSASELLSCCPPNDSPTDIAFDLAGYHIVARPLNSLDLANLRPDMSRAAARQALVCETVVHASLDGATVAPAELPAQAVTALAEKLVEVDPAADLHFALSCPDCRRAWVATFDITAYFWRELSAIARTMLEDVHQLATAYGWREDEILGLSTARRAFYLSRINP